MKIILLTLGLAWSGGLLTASTLGYIDIKNDRDFYIGVFGGCSAGLGLSTKKEQK